MFILTMLDFVFKHFYLTLMICVVLFGIIPTIIKIVRRGKRAQATQQKRHDESARIIQQLGEDMAGIQQAFKCPNCGASHQIDPAHIATFCSFCGAPLPKLESFTELALNYTDMKNQRDLELEKMRIADEKDKRDTRSIVIIFVPYFIGLFVLMIILALKHS